MIDTSLTRPPRLALVLGSGGVRSIAALGVHSVLVRAGLKPDLIVGCSSGALFGACIASGMGPEDSLRAAIKLWSPELTQKKRWRAYLEMAMPKLFGFDAAFSLRDSAPIALRLEQAFGPLRLETLPTALRVVATDSNTGETVVLHRGSVAYALRASMAVPFVFPSVVLDGRRLVDGVLADPLPVAVARDAEAIVAVGFRGSPPRRVDRPSRLFAQASTILMNNLQSARVSAARASGQRILELELPIDRRVGLWDTEAMPSIFETSVRSMERQLPALERLLAGPTGRSLVANG